MDIPERRKISKNRYRMKYLSWISYIRWIPYKILFLRPKTWKSQSNKVNKIPVSISLFNRKTGHLLWPWQWRKNEQSVLKASKNQKAEWWLPGTQRREKWSVVVQWVQSLSFTRFKSSRSVAHQCEYGLCYWTWGLKIAKMIHFFLGVFYCNTYFLIFLTYLKNTKILTILKSQMWMSRVTWYMTGIRKC